MGKAVKTNGEIPFPQSGDGNFFKFTVRDLLVLEEEYGEGNYFSEVERLIHNAGAKCFMLCVEVGLKHRKGDKVVPFEVDWDNPGVTIENAGIPILDAICATASGITYEEMLDRSEQQRLKIIQAQAEIEAKSEKDKKNSGEEGADPFGVSEVLDGLKQ